MEWPGRVQRPKPTVELGGKASRLKELRDAHPLELIGKELGMFIDRKEVGEPNEFERMSGDELEAFLRESMDSLSLLHNGHSKQ